jgi:hypothetical protein
MELSKSDKKAARTIIEKGLQQEFAGGLNQFRKLLNHWQEKESDNRETYHRLYKSVIDFDKHISSRYDDMRGRNYLFILVAQLNEGFINDRDLVNLSAEAQEEIKRIKYFLLETNS